MVASHYNFSLIFPRGYNKLTRPIRIRIPQKYDKRIILYTFLPICNPKVTIIILNRPLGRRSKGGIAG